MSSCHNLPCFMRSADIWLCFLPQEDVTLIRKRQSNDAIPLPHHHLLPSQHHHNLRLALSSVQFSSVQSLSHFWLFATPWIAARQASLSINNSQSSPKLISIEWVMPSSHLILCRPLLLLPPIPPSIRVFSNESTLRMRWPKYQSFSFSHQSFQWTPGTGLL